jgi:hypothetical protein
MAGFLVAVGVGFVVPDGDGLTVPDGDGVTVPGADDCHRPHRHGAEPHLGCGTAAKGMHCHEFSHYQRP